jgi:hypothetical protein
MLACAAAISLAVGVPAARADWTPALGLPKLDRATQRETIATLRKGAALGNRADVFAKLGDSISQSPTYLQGLGCGQWNLGRYSDLRPTIRQFAARPLRGESSECGRTNSFSRNSAAARGFAMSFWAIEAGGSSDPSCATTESPLVCELRLVRPAYALIMFGANDVNVALGFHGDPTPLFLANMGQIIATARRLGVVPVLSTIPPRGDAVDTALATEQLNAGLRRLAANRHAPLINLWRALAPLPNHGLYPDGLHLSVSGWPGCARPCDPNLCAPVCRAANFTPAGLAYGSDARNLITLLTLRRLSQLATGSTR